MTAWDLVDEPWQCSPHHYPGSFLGLAESSEILSANKVCHEDPVDVIQLGRYLFQVNAFHEIRFGGGEWESERSCQFLMNERIPSYIPKKRSRPRIYGENHFHMPCQMSTRPPNLEPPVSNQMFHIFSPSKYPFKLLKYRAILHVPHGTNNNPSRGNAQTRCDYGSLLSHVLFVFVKGVITSKTRNFLVTKFPRTKSPRKPFVT